MKNNRTAEREYLMERYLEAYRTGGRMSPEYKRAYQKIEKEAGVSVLVEDCPLPLSAQGMHIIEDF